MARIVNLESGWLNRQLDTASQRASELPQWLTRTNASELHSQESHGEPNTPKIKIIKVHVLNSGKRTNVNCFQAKR